MATKTILPTIIVSKVDISRLKHELDGLDQELHQAVLRQNGPLEKAPQTTAMLEELVAATKANLLQAEDRQNLIKMLSDIYAQAPVIHMSFAVTPSPSFLQKVVQWFRTEVHPDTLLQVGLQPSIAAGCVMRTPNKYFDFSLRKNIADKQGLLIEKLRGVTNEQQK